MNLSFIGKIGGKKFIMAMVGALMIAAQNLLGLSPDQVEMIVTILGVAIGAQGIADAATGGVTSSSTPTVDLMEVKRLEVEKARIIAEAEKNAE